MSTWMSVLWNTGALTLTLTLTPTGHLDLNHSFTMWVTLNGKPLDLYKPFGAFHHLLLKYQIFTISLWSNNKGLSSVLRLHVRNILHIAALFLFKTQSTERLRCSEKHWMIHSFFYYRSLLLSDISETSESIHGQRASFPAFYCSDFLWGQCLPVPRTPAALRWEGSHQNWARTQSYHQTRLRTGNHLEERKDAAQTTIFSQKIDLEKHFLVLKPLKS